MTRSASDPTGPDDDELPAGTPRAHEQRRMIDQTVDCPTAQACIDMIQERVQDNWEVAGIQALGGGRFSVRFRREEAITPFLPQTA
jgi:hypothetical protein